MYEKKSKRILYCASTVSHLRNFHQPCMQALADMGYTVVACSADDKTASPLAGASEFISLPFVKSIISPQNIKNIFRLKKIIASGDFCAISLHTTLAAVLCRLAVLLLPKGKRPKVFYTCHGYLFTEKRLKKKYLWPEKICSKATDVLMVMNAEDRRMAEKHRLYNGLAVYIPGMGVDFSNFNCNISKDELRRKRNIDEDDIIFVFAGEFSERKNQKELLDAFALALPEMPCARLLLAGDGVLLSAGKEQAESLGISDRTNFLGYEKNVPELYHLSDICVSASMSEGLPFNIMEAMYCSLPCIVSNVKGHTDLITDNVSGFVCKDIHHMAESMKMLYNNYELRVSFGEKAKATAEEYNTKYVLPKIIRIYDENL